MSSLCLLSRLTPVVFLTAASTVSAFQSPKAHLYFHHLARPSPRFSESYLRLTSIPPDSDGYPDILEGKERRDAVSQCIVFKNFGCMDIERIVQVVQKVNVTEGENIIVQGILFSQLH